MVSTLAQEFGGAPEDAAALIGRQGAPGGVRITRRGERQIQIRPCGERQLPEHLFGGRIDHRNMLAPLACDPTPRRSAA